MTYEYLCTSCGHEWEASQSIKDAPLKACPKCKKQSAKRQVSGGTGFVLKGGGWYADLYSSAKPAATSTTDKGDKTEASTAADTSSTSSDATAGASTTAGDGASSKAKPAKAAKGKSKAAE